MCPFFSILPFCSNGEKGCEFNEVWIEQDERIFFFKYHLQ